MLFTGMTLFNAKGAEVMLFTIGASLRVRPLLSIRHPGFERSEKPRGPSPLGSRQQYRNAVSCPFFYRRSIQWHNISKEKQ